jgi:hypothetical protein
MTDKKISELTAITGVDTASDDLFLIVDVSANQTKKITRTEMNNALDLNTIPVVVGGTTASSSLTLKSTSGVGTSDTILFKVGNNGATEAMRIDSAGDVGIGSTNPVEKLSVVGQISTSGAAAGFLLRDRATSASSSQWYSPSVGNTRLFDTTTSTDRIVIDSNGDVGIGESNPTHKLHVNGTVGVSGTVIAPNYYNNATQTATNTATLTAAQITGPFLLGTPTATASYTLPLASAVETALGTPANETGWEFVVFTTAAFAITLLTNTGWTLVGSMATGATANSFARFRCRKTGAAAYSIYRIS